MEIYFSMDLSELCLEQINFLSSSGKDRIPIHIKELKNQII